MTRISSRILAPLIHFDCHSSNYLYKTAQQIDWRDFLTLTKTFAIKAHVAESNMRNSHYAAQVLKDAIVDQFRERTAERPTIHTHFPDLLINLYIYKNQVRISIDLGAGSLHKRGYRKDSVEAPIQENVASTILRLSGWMGETTLYDPFCGSGTLLIEAAMQCSHTPAAFLRKKFGFLRLPDFDATYWNRVKTECNAQIQTKPSLSLCGSDIDAEAITIAKLNSQHIPAASHIEFKTSPFSTLPNIEGHTIITNPPHGIRLKNPSEAANLLGEFGDFLKQKCTGSTAWVYFGDKGLLKKIGLKPSLKIPLRSGGLEGTLAQYTLY
jgi:putative N6-adenine-specific DNA methylase